MKKAVRTYKRSHEDGISFTIKEKKRISRQGVNSTVRREILATKQQREQSSINLLHLLAFLERL